MLLAAAEGPNDVLFRFFYYKKKFGIDIAADLPEVCTVFL